MRKEPKPPEGRSDEELVSDMRKGDGSAFTILTERYMPLLAGRSSRFSHIAGAEAEDFVQEGLLALYRAASTFDDEKARFVTYAAVCIDNAMADAIRRYMRATHQNTDIYFNDMDEQVLHKEASSEKKATLVEDVYAQGEQSRIRMRQIETRLSQLEQRVLQLYLRGYSYRQISSQTGNGPKSVDNALQRVRRKLRPSNEPQAESCQQS